MTIKEGVTTCMIHIDTYEIMHPAWVHSNQCLSVVKGMVQAVSSYLSRQMKRYCRWKQWLYKGSNSALPDTTPREIHDTESLKGQVLESQYNQALTPFTTAFYVVYGHSLKAGKPPYFKQANK